MILAEGFLNVGGGHELYYQQVGNPAGPSFLFFHGGPGLGTSERDKQYFDLERCNLILFDQRGAGKSKAEDQLANNTTSDLVTDAIRLLDHLQVKRTFLFGGSWGSTLALLLALAHPERVAGMILRGIFTASKAEREHFEAGGVREVYPQAWQRYTQIVPEKYQHQVSEYYFKNILGADKTLSRRLAYEQAYYGISVSRKEAFSPTTIEAILEQANFENQARLLAHYSLHDFFLPDRYILDRLKEIPPMRVLFVHGYDDQITPLDTVFLVGGDLPNASTHLVEGGHSAQEAGVKEALQDAVLELLEQKK